MTNDVVCIFLSGFMNEILSENVLALTSGLQLARLGARHGYRFEGESVSLNAMFEIRDAAAHGRVWALQLWACPIAPVDSVAFSGHLVAQAALPPIGEVADENEGFEVRSFACPPAGSNAFTMVIALVSGRKGQFDELHDFAAYACPEKFIQPKMQGNIGYRLDGKRVRIDVEKIENPRPADNLSGSLSLELWALPQVYTGGAFHGAPLAGVIFEALPGQQETIFKSFDLPFTRPPKGTWQIVLMLREWTPAGFVTRDFTNFSERVSFPEEAAPVAEMSPVTVIEPKPVVADSKPAETKAQPAAVKPVKTIAIGADTKISVNQASIEELASVKSLPKKVAEAIVAKRPFSSLDELVKVKGMGAKLLAKVRAYLRL